MKSGWLPPSAWPVLLAVLFAGWPDDAGQAREREVDVAKVHGRIQFVESFPDFRVQVVNSFPDLRVQVVENFPDGPGKWQVVDSFPDYKIQLVDSFPDFRIQYVKSFPGVAK